MKLTIHTEGWYDAAHHLNNYEGACKNLHGHTYKLEVWVQGDTSQVDKAGILFDFGLIKEITKQFDHVGNLTELMGFNSTAENQVVAIFDQLHKLRPDLRFKVRVYEKLQPKESYAELGDLE